MFCLLSLSSQVSPSSVSLFLSLSLSLSLCMSVSLLVVTNPRFALEKAERETSFFFIVRALSCFPFIVCATLIIIIIIIICF